MIPSQTSFNISPFMAIYDIVVPKDNMLRQINELVDCSFIIEELKNKYCLDNGRNAVSPIRMFKYLLLKSIFDLSDVDVVERSKYDMSFKYFLDMAPEDPVINPSSLTKFRKLRLQDVNLLDMLIGKTVEIALEKEIIQSKTIIVDATHTKARYNQKSPKEFLQEKSKNVRKAVYQIDESMKASFPSKLTSNEVREEVEYCSEIITIVEKKPQIASIPAVKEKLNVLKEVVEDFTERLSFSNDPDARVGHKTADSSFFGFKTHIAMSDERIITAAIVTTGAKRKTYSVTIKSTEHREQEAFQASEEFTVLAKERYKIEAKNSELKHRHGYDEASSAGLFGMEIQGATAIFAVNLKRILTMINSKN